MQTATETGTATNLALEEEVWRPIPGLEQYYEASTHGRIRSFSRTVRQKTGKQYFQAGRLMKPARAIKNKYLSLRLTNQVETVTRYVHHLVLITFVGPAPEGHEGCHGDGDRTNNRLSNLRWDTRSNNHADKALHGTDHKGERHPGVKLTEAEVKAMRKRRLDDLSYAALAKEFGVTTMTAFRAVNGKTWGHIPPEDKEST